MFGFAFFLNMAFDWSSVHVQLSGKLRHTLKELRLVRQPLTFFAQSVGLTLSCKVGVGYVV